MFLRGPNEYHKTTSEFRRISLLQLSQTYESIFAEISRAAIEDMDKISDANKCFKQALADMKIIFKRCNETVNKFALYEDMITPLVKGIKIVNDFFVEFGGKEIKIDAREIYTNPYFLVLD